MDFESLSFEASFHDCFRKLPVDPAFVADFQSCVDIVWFLTGDAKLGSVDGVFVASVVGGGVGVDCGGGGVKDDIDFRMMVEYIGEDSMITEICTVRSVEVCLFGTPGLTLVPLFVTEGLIFAALGTVLVTVPEQLG
nr:hypothetical protein [Tanacetum cinerariifolium]